MTVECGRETEQRITQRACKIWTDETAPEKINAHIDQAVSQIVRGEKGIATDLKTQIYSERKARATTHEETALPVHSGFHSVFLSLRHGKACLKSCCFTDCLVRLWPHTFKSELILVGSSSQASSLPGTQQPSSCLGPKMVGGAVRVRVTWVHDRGLLCLVYRFL